MGLNLHRIVSPVVSAVNAPTKATVQISTGPIENADGTITPTFASPVTVRAQVQPMSWRDIQMVEGLNLQGTRRTMFLNGQVDGLVRVLNKGGDLVTIAAGAHAGVWLVAMVAEQWPGWVKCFCTMQNEAPV